MFTMRLQIPRPRTMKMKICMLATLILISYLISTYLLIEKWYSKKNKTSSSFPVVNFEYIVVHLDLKGAPPKLSYLESILPMLRDHGANGLLIEYEDMFPYEGKLVNLSARNAYTKKELNKFLTIAMKSGFEIIPLIQTFGHLEFALKLPEFKHLREEPKFPDSICPSKKESQEFLKDVLQQVITFHQKVAPIMYFHIGCDEVFHLNRCNSCYKRNISSVNTFLSHIDFVTEVVRNLSASTTVLIWDDMFRRIKPSQCVDLKYPHTEPVYWEYSAYNLEGIHQSLYKYKKMFENMWVATAFKGADGPAQTIPDLEARFKNNLYWMEFILKYGSTLKMYNFKGIILTGWARYNHMNPLCELLPVSIPSLILNLILIDKYHTGLVFRDSNDIDTFLTRNIENDFNKALTCRNSLDGSLNKFEVSTCLFDSTDLYDVLVKCLEYESAHNKRFTLGYDGSKNVVSVKDLKLGYVDMTTVKQIMDYCASSLIELQLIESQITEIMSLYFDKYVVQEYIVFKVSRMKKDVSDLFEYLKNNYVVKEWPRGPLNISFKNNESSVRNQPLAGDIFW